MPIIEEDTRSHWSYSAINEYIICPLKYYFHRVVKQEPEFISANVVLGKALHSIYSLVLNLAYPKMDPISQSDIEAAFVATFDELRTNNINYNGSSYKATIGKGQKFAHTITDYLLKKDFNGEELWIAKQFMVPLIATDGTIYEEPLMGVFDLVAIDHAKKSATIIDFKTISRQYPQWRMFRNLQMLTYTYAMHNLVANDYRILFQWDFLLKQKDPKIVPRKYLCTQTEIQHLLGVIDNVVRGIKNEVYYPHPSYICPSCEYSEACKEWTADTQKV